MITLAQVLIPSNSVKTKNGIMNDDIHNKMLAGI